MPAARRFTPAGARTRRCEQGRPRVPDRGLRPQPPVRLLHQGQAPGAEARERSGEAAGAPAARRLDRERLAARSSAGRARTRRERSGSTQATEPGVSGRAPAGVSFGHGVRALQGASRGAPVRRVTALAYLGYRRAQADARGAGRPLPEWREWLLHRGPAGAAGGAQPAGGRVGDKLFAAHMAQHLAIGDFAALLLVIGTHRADDAAGAPHQGDRPAALPRQPGARDHLWAVELLHLAPAVHVQGRLRQRPDPRLPAPDLPRSSADHVDAAVRPAAQARLVQQPGASSATSSRCGCWARCSATCSSGRGRSSTLLPRRARPRRRVAAHDQSVAGRGDDDGGEHPHAAVVRVAVHARAAEGEEKQDLLELRRTRAGSS